MTTDSMLPFPLVGEGSAVRGLLSHNCGRAAPLNRVCLGDSLSTQCRCCIVCRPQPPLRGFTLVELLVVITIIGILVALISVVAVNALYQAKQVRIKFEVDQMDAAMKSFKQQYGAYPPCDLRTPAANTGLKSFVSKAFPRYNQGLNGAQLAADLQTAGVNTAVFDPARALAFWLSGFNPDVTHPFTDSTTVTLPYTGSRTPLYGFDKTRLLFASTIGSEVAGQPATASARTGNLVYVPAGGQGVPFVYYDYRAYTIAAANPQPVSPARFAFNPSSGEAQPYALDANNNGVVDVAPGADTWANADSFQIISAGQDGNFGAAVATASPKLFPRGTNYDTAGADDDNVTNFNDKASLEDAKP